MPEIRRGRLTKAWGDFQRGDLVTDDQATAEERGSGLSWVDAQRFDRLEKDGYLTLLKPEAGDLSPADWTLKTSPAYYLERYPDGPHADKAGALLKLWTLSTDPSDYLDRYPDGPNAELARILTRGTGAAEEE
jgi:hypothetical protein